MSFQVSTVVWKCAPNSIVGYSEIKQLKSEVILFGEETPIVSESEIISTSISCNLFVRLATISLS